MLTCDEYVTPKTLGEALAVAARSEGRSRFVAGTTDILPWAREGRAGDVHLPLIVDIADLPELNEVRLAGDRLWIGGATRFQRFLDNHDLIDAAPGMPDCAIWFADQQIRESATIGGNLMNASPAGDGIPPLLAANAIVELASLREGDVRRRRLPLSTFLMGPGRTAAEPDELLTGVECDALHGYGGAFEKVGHRRSLVISVACVSAIVKMERDRRSIADLRLAMGGVGPVALRLHTFEQALTGVVPSAELLNKLLPECDDLVRSRSRQVYRKHVARGFVVRALRRALVAAGATDSVCASLCELEQ